MVDCYNGFILESSGSGVIYKKVGSIYYVLTNEHVVYGYTSSEFQITIFETNGDIVITKGNVTLLGKSVTHDMAILRFSSLQSLRVIEWGTKDSLKVGQMVFAIGSPLDLPNSVSMGTISAIDRGMWDDYGMDTITIQHTATINPGNSGGALVNIYGQMIGLNNMSYVDEYVGEGIEGLHFAIQIDILTQMIPTLE
ncbi:MAG: trypsin-like peptidase domain-containing protein, partial [Bacillota bacterium]